MLQERIAAKKAKDFKRADEIRELCSKAGYAIVDAKEGSLLKRV